MSEFYEEQKKAAADKLRTEFKTAKGDKYGEVVKKPLLDKLISFCEQDEEFAQAVVQGGSFEEALKAAVKGAQNHTPDDQVYRQAVQFYFPGADVIVNIRIELNGASTDAEPEQAQPREKHAVILNLSDFL